MPNIEANYTTFWSSLSGVSDTPENYNTITYKLSAEGNGTTLTLTQDNNASQEEVKHSEGNWNMVLNALKQLLEQ